MRISNRLPLLALFTRVATVLAATWLLAACHSTPDVRSAVAPVSFADYQRATLDLLRERRSFQTTDHDAELAWNGPGEWRPAGATGDGKPAKGILLVHGLGDSPWSFHDVAERLAAEGFLVRTVLLQGHGTRPEDLLTADVDDWRRLVHQQAETLRRDVDGPVYLGGFSTGANLVTEVAYERPEFAGLVLFSPGFRTSVPLGWIAPLAAMVMDWPVKPGTRLPAQNAVRYLNAPTNGFAQFYWTSRTAQRLVDDRPYDKPVFMVVAQHDSVLDADFLLDVFQKRFTHPASRLVWYGATPARLTDTARVLVRDDKMPEFRISQFSHMGVLFSPGNALYGQQGRVRMCLNGQSAQESAACDRGAEVWYSDWGYREPGKVHARLTFNPYFDWQSDVLSAVLRP